MSRQAEAERERRARVISAEGELQASEKLSQAAAAMAEQPAALQLRLLETVVQVSSEKNSTLILPFPVELLRFFEASTGAAAATAVAAAAATERHESPPPPVPLEQSIPERPTPLEQTGERPAQAWHNGHPPVPAGPPDAG
jgi:hypothetical protein